MELVERHIFVGRNDLEDICVKSKLLYNQCLYYFRQSVRKEIQYFTEFEISKLMAEFNHERYRALPTQTSQQVIRLLFKNIKSWHALMKLYNKNPGKFQGKPKLPKYKKEQFVTIFTSQQVKVKDGYIHFVSSVLKPLKTKVIGKIYQVRIIPQATCHIIEVVYEKEKQDLNLNKSNVISLDLGINNYVSTINNVDESFIINGKIIKSFNHWYNKKKAKLQSYIGDKGTSNKLRKLNNYRNNWIEDKNHKISRYIINYCISKDIGKIVIGNNEGWKQNVNLGKNTQNFVQIPFSKLIAKIKYKAELVGIEVITTEESYTSKCDNLALENLGKNVCYLGKRVKRGLFQSSIGKLINADINGSIGILRKVIDDSTIKTIINNGLGYNPFKLNIV